MEANRWEDLHEFPLLDLTAVRGWMSASSVTFWLRFNNGEPKGATELRVVGHLDLHHPCAGHTRARVRACLPERYFTVEHMRDMTRELFDRVGIPHDETYECLFVVPEKKMMLLQNVDRHGSTGRAI